MAQLTEIDAAETADRSVPFQPSASAAPFTPIQEEQVVKKSGVRRTFRPTQSRRYGRPTSEFPPARLVRYSPKYQYSRLLNFPFPGAHFQPRMNTVVIQVQGIAHFNHTANPDSLASVGVYFGPQCARNSFYMLPIQLKHTANLAILEAIRCALQHVMMMRNTEFFPGWKEVIIMTNSDYAKRSLSEWVWAWEKKDWTRVGKNEPIENLEAMQNLQNVLTYIESYLDMSVRFWKVGREDVACADALARIAMGCPGGSVQ